MGPRRSTRHTRQNPRTPSPEQDPDYIDLDMTRHPCLQFTSRRLDDKYLHLAHKYFHDTYYIDWDAIDAIGIRTYVIQTVPASWLRLLAIDVPTYEELTLEFHSTYRFDDTVTDPSAASVYFRMRGQVMGLPLQQFGRILGIYQSAEEEEGRLGVHWTMNDDDRVELWHALTGLATYTNTNHKATRIRDPRIRILHRFISQGLYSRVESAGNVTHGDLLFLSSVLLSRYFCPAYMLASEFPTLSGKNKNQRIAGGRFITTLALHLNVDLSDCTKVGRTIPLSVQLFKNLKVIAQRGEELTLLDQHGEDWVNPDAPQPGQAEPQDAHPAHEDARFHETTPNFAEMFSFTPDPRFTPPISSAGPIPHTTDFRRQDSPAYQYGAHHFETGSSSSQPYYPPQSYYDEVLTRLKNLEVGQAEDRAERRRREEIEDARWKEQQAWHTQYQTWFDQYQGWNTSYHHYQTDASQYQSDSPPLPTSPYYEPPLPTEPYPGDDAQD